VASLLCQEQQQSRLDEPTHLAAAAATTSLFAFGAHGDSLGHHYMKCAYSCQELSWWPTRPTGSTLGHAIARWRDRNVLSIPACQSCPVASVCGGGCGAVAVNCTGTVAGPDCRPVRELLGLGARYYRLGDD
jgi:radical SAM protein with 4Fe4S-binding SPASM domain